VIRTFILICLVLLFASGTSVAQKSKPWTEWSEKDAEKILNDWAWGQTQSEESVSQPSQTSAISSTTAARERTVRDAGAAATSAQSGEAKAPVTIRYRVRFLSAKPNSGTVRFYAEFSNSFKLNMQYKVTDMTYDQKLEY
jgi:hypothetical protein